MRKTLLSTLAVAVLLGTCGVGLAQEGLKPVVVVSFAGYDELMADIGLIGKLGGNPELAKGLEGLLAMMTGGKGLDGLDKSKPWGAVVQSDGQGFPVTAFVPVTNLKTLLAALAGPLGAAKDAGDGVFQVEGAPVPLFVKEKGGWAFIAQTPDGFKNAPADPSKLLGELPKKYDVAVNVSIKNVPDGVRQGLIGLMQMGAQAGLQQEPGESDEQFAVRRKLTEQSIQQMVRVINDLETILVGLSINSETKTAYLEATVTATAGSETAKDMAEMTDLKTEFAGLLLPDASVVARFTGKLSDSDVAQMQSSLVSIRARALNELSSQGLPAEGEKKAKELLGGLIDIIEETVKSKQVDGGVVVRLAPDTATLVAAGHVADGAKLEKLLKEIADVAKQEQPDVAKLIKLDAEKYEDVNLHVISVPLPADDPGAQKLAKLIGDKAEVIVGTGAKSTYVAAGRDAMKMLKEVIDKSKADTGKAVLPMQISVAVGPIAKFIAAVADEPEARQGAQMVAGILAQAAGKDHVLITSKAVPNGAIVRIEVEEGILKALGMAGQMAAAGGAPGGAAPPAPKF